MINIYYLRTQYLKTITDTSKCGLFSATLCEVLFVNQLSLNFGALIFIEGAIMQSLYWGNYW